MQRRIHRRPATLRNVPWRPLLWILRIAHVARRLRMDTDRIQRDQHRMHDRTQQRMKDMCDEHNPLHEQYEQAQHSDHDVEVRDELAPWQRGRNGAVVGVGVDYLLGVAVPAMVRAFLP